MKLRNTLYISLFAAVFAFGTASAQEVKPSAAAEGDAGVLADFEIPEMVQVKVRHGESLYDLAQMSGVSVEALENINSINLNDGLTGGQSLVIPMTKEAETRFQANREAFADARKETFLARRGGLVEVKPYRVRTGDSAWNISRKHGKLPVWILRAFNPETNLNRISIGQTLFVPVVGDTLPPAEKPAGEPHGAVDGEVEEEIGC